MNIVVVRHQYGVNNSTVKNKRRAEDVLRLVLH